MNIFYLLLLIRIRYAVITHILKYFVVIVFKSRQMDPGSPITDVNINYWLLFIAWLMTHDVHILFQNKMFVIFT